MRARYFEARARLLGTGGTSAPGQINIRPEMMGLTLIIAGRTLFGTFLADDIATVHRCMDDLMNNYVRAVVPWGKILNYLPLASTRKLARARLDLFAVVDRIIAARRREVESPQAGAAPRQDLLSLMIAATDEETAAKTRLTDKQLRDQCITLLTAGHETTANAMTFTLYLLATHPQEQTRLREEITAVLGTSAESVSPSCALLDRLPRTRWVLSESMRLYPPAWTMGRQNQREVTLGNYRLPPKCTILIPQWTLHRDPRYFTNPLDFTPDRWENPTHPPLRLHPILHRSAQLHR